MVLTDGSTEVITPNQTELYLIIFSITLCTGFISHVLSNQKLPHQNRFIWLLFAPLLTFFLSLLFNISNITDSNFAILLILLISIVIILIYVINVYFFNRHIKVIFLAYFFISALAFFGCFKLLQTNISSLPQNILSLLPQQLLINFKALIAWKILFGMGWFFILSFLTYYFWILYGYSLKLSLKKIIIIHSKSFALKSLIPFIRKDESNEIQNKKSSASKKIPTGIHFLDSSLGDGINIGDVIVFEGEIGNSLEDVMTHLLYSGLLQGYYSIYVAVSRPPEHVFYKFDLKIKKFNSRMYSFTKALVKLNEIEKTKYNTNNKRFWGMIVNNLIYELEKVAVDNRKLTIFRESLIEKIKNENGIQEEEMINSISELLVGSANEKILKSLKQNNSNPNKDKKFLPTFEDFIEKDLLYIIDYNKGLIREDKSKIIGDYRKLFNTYRYHSIDNSFDIENLHGCFRNIRGIINNKRKKKEPIWQVWDSSSTIFHLTVRDRDSLHKTMDFFFHQASSAKENDYVIFHSFKKGIHDERYIKHLEHMADGVVNLYVKNNLASTPFKFMRVAKMKNATIASTETPYRINEGFIEKMWW